MKKISKKVREEAIDALVSATDIVIADGNGRNVEANDPLDIDTPVDVRQLANDALSAIWRATMYRLSVDGDWLEAAALLRDGWSPGDPVYLLRGAK